MTNIERYTRDMVHIRRMINDTGFYYSCSFSREVPASSGGFAEATTYATWAGAILVLHLDLAFFLKHHTDCLALPTHTHSDYCHNQLQHGDSDPRAQEAKAGE